MCVSLRILCLTDWCPSSRHDNHRSGVHFAAGVFETVDGWTSPLRTPTSTLNTATRTVCWFTDGKWTVLVQMRPQRHRVRRENNSGFLFICRPLDTYLHFTCVNRHFIIRFKYLVYSNSSKFVWISSFLVVSTVDKKYVISQIFLHEISWFIVIMGFML